LYSQQRPNRAPGQARESSASGQYCSFKYLREGRDLYATIRHEIGHTLQGNQDLTEQEHDELEDWAVANDCDGPVPS
jgi:hypothetical protein